MNAWMLAKKDLSVYFGDKAGVLLGIGLPIVLATVFGMAMGAVGGGGGGMGRARIYVEDRDGTQASAELVAALAATSSLSVRLVDIAAADAGEAESAREHVADGDGPAGLFIRAGYGDALGRGEMPPLVLFRDPGKAIDQQIVAAGLISVMLKTADGEVARIAMHRSLDRIDFPEAAQDTAHFMMDESWDRMHASGGGLSLGSFDLVSAMEDLLGMEVRDVVGGEEAKGAAQQMGAQAHAVAGIAVMMLLFGLVACGGTLLDEEAEGTLDRLRLAPGASRSILSGKFLFTWIIGLIQLLILFLYGNVLFDIPIFRAPFAIFLLSCALAAAATGFGVLFAVLCRTRKQLEGLSTIVILSMSALGGSWWPLSQTPEWYQELAHFTLTAWAMDGYQGLFWYGKDVFGILPEIGVLCGIAAGTSALALYLWRRRELVG